MPATKIRNYWTSGNFVFAETTAGNGGQVVFTDDCTLAFGTDSDITLTWTSATLRMSAAADDSVWEIGIAAATQKSLDVKIYQNAASGADYFLFDASESALTQAGASAYWIGKMKYTSFGVTTATAIAVAATQTGRIFVNMSTAIGAAGTLGRVNYTLPSPATGLFYTFVNGTAASMKVTGANNMVTFNNSSATSIYYNTAGELIGATVDIIGLASKWIVRPNGANTITIA